MPDILIELNRGRMRKGDSETARQNEQERERGRVLCRAKRLNTPDLSFSAAFSRDGVLHNRQKWRRRKKRERGGL